MEKRKLVKFSLMIIFFTLILVSVLFIIGNNYQMNEKNEPIQTENLDLAATITIPKGRKIKGTIVFVHGDGPQTATQEGGYKPLMERFAKQGYVSISWDKPGIGKSEGNWLKQTMDDRVKETTAVIDWLQENYPMYTKKIGLWGASQAGWVIPKVMNETSSIDFAILVGPAINWLRQGEYTTSWRIKKSGGTTADVRNGVKDFIADSKLITQNSTYTEYKQAGGKEHLTNDRYSFIRKNLTADATEDLSKIAKKVYLILAENDQNIDTSETKTVYETELTKKNLDVNIIPNTEHMMINPRIADSKLLVTAAAIFLPKYVLIDSNYLDYCEQIAKSE